jgi:hypothetical protein
MKNEVIEFYSTEENPPSDIKLLLCVSGYRTNVISITSGVFDGDYLCFFDYKEEDVKGTVIGWLPHPETKITE